MYTHTSGGTAAAHLLVKRPIIIPIIATLLAMGAWASMTPTVKPPQALAMKVPAVMETAKIKISAFDAIKKVESNNKNRGVHPDGRSYGPAGLTKVALKDVLPGRSDDEYRRVLNDPEQSVKYAEMYFNRLKKYYNGSEALAIIAYHHGIGHVNNRLKKGVPLYKDYLEQVNKYRTGEKQ